MVIYIVTRICKRASERDIVTTIPNNSNYDLMHFTALNYFLLHLLLSPIQNKGLQFPFDFAEIITFSAMREERGCKKLMADWGHYELVYTPLGILEESQLSVLFCNFRDFMLTELLWQPVLMAECFGKRSQNQLNICITKWFQWTSNEPWSETLHFLETKSF